MNSHDFHHHCQHIMQSQHLTALEKYIAIAQALYDDKPSIMRIAERTGLGIGTVEFIQGELARKQEEAQPKQEA